MRLDIEKNPSRAIKHQNKDIKIASSRELLPQQKTLPPNPEELKSEREKKPFVRKKKGDYYSLHKLLLFLYGICCQFQLQVESPLLIKPQCFTLPFLMVVLLVF